MAKLRRVDLFSKHFGVPPEHLAQVGALDPVLNMDTHMFINPLLLARSGATQMEAAWRRYQKWFEDLGYLLKQCQKEGDADWTCAFKLLHFHEPPSTCLGQAVEGTKGRGIGGGFALNLVRSAHSLVKSGTTVEELMVCLPFLCKGLGPDRISDMVTQIIMQDLASYTQSALNGFDLARMPLPIGSDSYQVPRYEDKPILLVPLDVLADIKVVHSIRSIAKIAKNNNALRKRISKRLEWMIREGAQGFGLDRANHREEIAVFCKQVVKAALRYDSEADPSGHIAWRSALAIARNYAIPIQASDDPVTRAQRVVEQFGILLAVPAMAELLYFKDRRPRPERELQRLFFAIATTYCEAGGNMVVEYDLKSGLTAFLSRGAAILTVDVASSSKQCDWRNQYLSGSHRGRIFVFVNFGSKKGAAALALMNERRQRRQPAAEVQVVEPARVTGKGAIPSFVKGPLVKCP